MVEFKLQIDPHSSETTVRYSLLEAVDFMAAFIDQQNEQARLFCERFDQTSIGAHGFSYDDCRDELKVSGISGFNYDLDGVFKEDFPVYVIESQVIMLWAMLEKNLDAIATELYSIRQIPWMKLKGKGSFFLKYIERIEKIDEKSFDRSLVDFFNFNVREVRNALVHGGVRQVDISHEYLDIRDGVLHRIHFQYISKIIENLRYLAQELVAADR